MCLLIFGLKANTNQKNIFFFFSQQAQSFLKSCRLLDMWQGVRKQICKSPPPFQTLPLKKKKKKKSFWLAFLSLFM